MEKMYVAMATDKFYLKQTCVAIESFLMASKRKDVYYFVYVLMPNDDIGKAFFYFDSIRKKYLFCNIEIIEINDIFNDASIRIEHITIPTYYRLLLPEIIKEDKCLYLDSDVIICDDLSYLYDLDIKDYDLGGVIAPMQHQMEKKDEYAKKIGIPSMDQYINAGVLLLNLGQLRKREFVKKAVGLVKCPFPTQDQDIINRISYDRIKLLPYKYNVQTSRKKYLNILEKQELLDTENNPVILHYSDMEKPWEYLDTEQSDRWWMVCKDSLIFRDFLEEQKENFFYYSVVKNLRLWKLEKFSIEWINEIQNYKKCYIYGAGIKGKRAVSYFKKNNVDISGIIVTELEGNIEQIQGIEVKKVSNEIETNALIFVAIEKKYQVQIKRILFKYNIFYIMPLFEI